MKSDAEMIADGFERRPHRDAEGFVCWFRDNAEHYYFADKYSHSNPIIPIIGSVVGIWPVDPHKAWMIG